MMLLSRSNLSLGLFLASTLLASGFHSLAVAAPGPGRHLDAGSGRSSRSVAPVTSSASEEQTEVATVSFAEPYSRDAVPMRAPLSEVRRRYESPRARGATNHRPGSRSMISGAAYQQPVEEVMGSPAGEFMSEGETIYSDEGTSGGYYEEGYSEGDYYEDGYGGGSCGDGYCGDDPYFTRGVCLPLCLPPLPIPRFENLSLFAGVNAFTGPANRGGTGSFGFAEGFNWGNHFAFSRAGLSYQVGAMVTQSNFSGTDFTLDTRDQFFLTGGIFRRVDCGLQGGIVFDYFHDEWYYQLDLTQLRYELSWVFDGCQEVGFWGASGLGNQITTATFRTNNNGVVATTTEDFTSTDIFAAFYRRKFGCGGEGRFWGGATGQQDGIIGADMTLPVTTCVDLTSSFTYLIPDQGPNDDGVVQESWNVFVGLVWYPGCMRRCDCPYDRPLFNVANNGSFMVDRTQR